MPRKSLISAGTAPNFEALTRVNRTPAEWREGIATIDAKLVRARARAADLTNETEIVELSVAWGHDGAEAQAVAHREQERLLEAEITGLVKARARAAQELSKAEAAERANRLDVRIAEAQGIGREIAELAVSWDAIATALGNVTKRLFELHRVLTKYSDIPEVARHNFPNAYTLRGALAAAGGHALTHLLELPAMPSEHRKPLAEREARKFTKLLGIETKAGTIAARLAAVDPDKRAAIEERILIDYPDLGVDADHDEPSEIADKAARRDALLLERCDAPE